MGGAKILAEQDQIAKLAAKVGELVGTTISAGKLVLYNPGSRA